MSSKSSKASMADMTEIVSASLQHIEDTLSVSPVLPIGDSGEGHSIAGIPVHGSYIGKEGDGTSLRARYIAFTEDRAVLTARLQHYGVTPLTVLPLAAWNRLCEKAGLYRFAPRGDRVRSRIDVIDAEAQAFANKIHSKIDRVGALLVIPSFLICAVPFGILASYVPNESIAAFIGFIGALAALIGALVIPYMLMSRLEPGGTEANYVKRTKEILSVHEHQGTLKAAMWPNFIEPEKGVDVRIALPDAPTAVQDSLRHLGELSLSIQVAVSPEAITFVESPEETITGVAQTRWDRERVEYLEWADSCPFVYVTDGSAVAIFAQYGVFPFEQTLLNQELNAELLV